MPLCPNFTDQTAYKSQHMVTYKAFVILYIYHSLFIVYRCITQYCTENSFTLVTVPYEGVIYLSTYVAIL